MSGPSADHNHTHFSGWVVLIVDDEPDNVLVAQKVLTYHGAVVHVARNGIEGIELWEDLQPTFVLLDLSMPELDGFKTLEMIRQLPNGVGCPLIALTAHAMVGDRERVMRAGFDGYIAKPFRLDTFLRDITAILEAKLDVAAQHDGTGMMTFEEDGDYDGRSSYVRD